MNEQPPPERPKRRFTVPISWKLLWATAVVGAVAAAISIIGLKCIRTLNQNLTTTVNFLATNVTLASVVKQDLITATRAERNMWLAKSKDGRESFAAVVVDVAKAMDGRLKELRAVVDEAHQHQLDLFSEKWVKWRENHETVRRFTLMNADDEARNSSLGEESKAVDRLEKAVEVIVHHYQRDFDAGKQADDYRQATAAAEKLNLAAAVSRTSLEMQRAEKNLALAPTEDTMRRYEETFELLLKNLESRIKQLREAVGDDDVSAMEDVQKAYEDYVDVNRRVRTMTGENNSLVAYHFLFEVGMPIAAECESLLDDLIEQNERQMQDYRRASQQAYLAARNALLGISISGIVVSVAISFYTGQGIARRLGLLSRYAKTIQSTGDLSKATPPLGNDEVGMLAESFDLMRQSLHRHAASLSEQAARLAELTQTLEEKNREMEQFVYTVSHDLKSPLVSCKGLLGLLKEDVASEDYDAILESVERLDQATDQLNQIIEDLLMLSRIGRKSLDFTEVDVRGLVGDLVQELSDRTERANATIDVQTDLPRVIADSSDVRRVFENLLINSLKYGCDAANPRITIGGTRASGEVRYFIRDNGAGIDPKYHERIFGLFQRLDTQQPGTGLGLASVEKIMNMHSGRVWVESEIGQGATFCIAFPDPPRRQRQRGFGRVPLTKGPGIG